MTPIHFGTILPYVNNNVNDRVDDCESCADETGSCSSDEVPFGALYSCRIPLSHIGVCVLLCVTRNVMKGDFFMKKMKTQTLVLSSLLMAMHIVLSFFTITLPIMKINLSGLPIIVGGFLFGPMIGTLVGLLGSLLYQILSYGLMSTTILWIIPHAVRGFIVGFWAKMRNYKLVKMETVVVIIISSVTATILNTIGMYIDGIVWGYEVAAFASIGLRLANSVITSIIYVLIVIPLMKPLRKYFHITEK